MDELCRISPKKYDPNKDTINYKCIELEHIEQNIGTINGFTWSKNQQSIKNKFNASNVLFGKLRPYLKKFYNPNFEGVCSSEIWVLEPTNIIKKDYLFYLIQSNKFITAANISCGSKMPRADWDYMKEISFSIPDFTTQTKIATFLNLYYKKIELQRKKVDLLKLQKHQIINTIFKFDDKVNYIKLNKLLNQISIKNKNNLDVPVLSVSNKFGFIPQSEQFEEEVASDDKSNYKLVKLNQFAYNPARINVGSIAKLIDPYTCGQISPMYVCFECDSTLNSDYFGYYLQSSTFKKEMQKRLEGSVRMCLTFESLCNIKIYLQELSKQLLVVDKLKKIDLKIKTETTKLLLLEKYKQGLLQKMFI